MTRPLLRSTHGVLGTLSLLACHPSKPNQAPEHGPANVSTSDPGCVELAFAPQLTSTAVFADEHALLVGGFIHAPPLQPGAYLVKLDDAGAIVWRQDFEYRFGVSAIIAWKHGYAALLPGSSHTQVLEVSEMGEVSTLVELAHGADAPLPHGLLEHKGRLLLAGERARDLWIGELGETGEIETIMVEDGRGFDDAVVQLLAVDDELVALARVGVASGTDYDLVGLDPSETHVISYTDTGAELGRAILSGRAERSTMVGAAMARGPSGNIIAVGYEGLGDTAEVRAWAASVVGCEVNWLRRWSEPDPQGQLSAAALVGPDVILAGHVRTLEGSRRWHVRADAVTGEVYDEYVGTEITAVEDGYRAAALGSPHAAWLVGDRRVVGSVSLWACRLTDGAVDRTALTPPATSISAAHRVEHHGA